MATKFFEVGNAAGRGCYILANNIPDAGRIALQLGHVRKITSAKVYGPKHMSKDNGFASLSFLMEKNRRGQVAKRGRNLTFDQVVIGPKPHTPEWFLIAPAA